MASSPATAGTARRERAHGDGGLDDVPVSDVMHAGIIECDPSTSITSVAAVLADHGVHAAVVTGVERTTPGEERLVQAIVDATDVLAGACQWISVRSASDVASPRPVVVSEDDSVKSAARLMSEHGVAHIVAVDVAGTPTGMISALDVASVCASL